MLSPLLRAADFSQVVSLDFSKNDIDQEALEIFGSRDFSSLESLDLSGCFSPGLYMLTRNDSLKKLTKLNLSKIKVLTSEEIRALSSPNFHNLTHLSLQGAFRPNLKVLASCGLTKLKSLNLYACLLDDVEFSFITKEAFPSLETLYLGKNMLFNPDMDGIEERLPNVRIIHEIPDADNF